MMSDSCKLHTFVYLLMCQMKVVFHKEGQGERGKEREMLKSSCDPATRQSSSSRGSFSLETGRHHPGSQSRY